MSAIVKLTKGKLQYEVLGHSDGQLTLRDPHTKKSFKVPHAKQVLKTCGYKVIRRPS